VKVADAIAEQQFHELAAEMVVVELAATRQVPVKPYDWCFLFCPPKALAPQKMQLLARQHQLHPTKDLVQFWPQR
jgi:hypothetical protein